MSCQLTATTGSFQKIDVKRSSRNSASQSAALEDNSSLASRLT